MHDGTSMVLHIKRVATNIKVELIASTEILINIQNNNIDIVSYLGDGRTHCPVSYFHIQFRTICYSVNELSIETTILGTNWSKIDCYRNLKFACQMMTNWE